MEKIVKIEKISHQGKGIGKIDEKIIFIPNTCKGEEIKVEITKDTKNYMEGKIVELLKKSEDRVEFSCPYYNKCGGCSLAHIKYDKQLEIKKEIVKNIFERYVGITIEPKILESIDKLHYRNKVVMHVEKDKMGFYQEESNELVPIDKCLLLNEEINKTIWALSMNLEVANLKDITIRGNGDSTLVKFTGNEKLNNDNAIFFGKKSILDQKATDELKENAIVFKLGEYKFAVTADAFFQVNTKQAINLYNKVRDYAKLDKINTALDLYCGTGTIGIYISDLCNKVVGVEINKESIKCANYNKLLNKVDNIEFIEGDVSTVINNEMHPDLIVVDPPRSGLDDKTISTIKQIKPKRIIYVSCDPMSLARDINNLSEEYELKDIELLDMFPNTYHVECVCLLQLC